MVNIRKRNALCTRHLFVAICLSLLVAPTSAAQSEIAGIDAYVAKINQFMKVNKSSARIFADVSGSDDNTDRWQEFRNEDEMEKVRTGDNLNTIAFVSTNSGKVNASSFTFTSPSGDWAHLITYYFREDGSLAKIHAELNTFYGNLSVIRDLYFNNRGVLLKNTRRYLDLKTKKVRKPGEFFDHTVPLYRNVRELPFHKLL